MEGTLINTKKLLIIFTVFLILFVLIGSVSAANDNTTTLNKDTGKKINQDKILNTESSTGDIDSGGKEIKNKEILKANNENKTLKDVYDGFDEIRNKIENAESGDTIEIDGYYCANNPRDVIQISKSNLTLIGINGATLDGKPLNGDYKSAIFEITGNNITLKNLKIVNGYSSFSLEKTYGVIEWQGDYGSIINSTFINNTVYDYRSEENHTGIINWKGNYGSIINSTFINNKPNNNQNSIDSGSPIHWYGLNGSVVNSTFINNTAGYGGAIYWEGTYGTLIKSTFINNTGDIGAIYWEGTYGTLINSTFINNPTDAMRGVIFWEGTYGTLINSTFINNTGKWSGVIYWDGHNGTIINSTFINNTGDTGSAITWNGHNGTVINSKFINNTANHDWQSGAITWSGISGTIINSTFIRNTALRGYGGAIFWEGDGNRKGRIINSIFINNTAAEAGGAILIETNNCTIINSTFINNTANNGGAIYTWGENHTVINQLL